MPKIVAISVPYPGVCRVLEEGEKLALWEFIRLTNENGVDIPAVADLYILGAWHSIYGELLDALKVQGRSPRVVVLWTSSAGEVGLEPAEQQVLAEVMADQRIEAIWFADKSLATVFPGKGFYAPYPLYAPDRIPERKAGAEPYMTLFCPSTLKKNIFTQLVAAVLIQRERPELTLFTNVQVPKVFQGHMQYREMGWLPQERYEEVMAGSILNFACSFAETFHYQAAEAALMWQVPSVCSWTIPWAPFAAAWRVRNASDAAEIASKALRVMHYGNHFQVAAQRWAKRANPALATRVREILAK